MVLPGRNFARYLLMCFMLFCLVVRTAYQGKQYEFMQKIMWKPDIQTIDEMVEQNFKLFYITLRGLENFTFYDKMVAA